MKSNLKYIIEGLVIIFSVFLSFYFEDIRKGKEDFNTKNELVNDLILSLDDDLTQIDNLINILQNSEKYITDILNDIDSNHKNISESLGIDFYFTHPYSSWEKGTNENTNGLIRQYFPKGTDFNNISEAMLKEVEIALNSRPRKCLEYKTPIEVLKVV